MKSFSNDIPNKEDLVDLEKFAALEKTVAEHQTRLNQFVGWIFGLVVAIVVIVIVGITQIMIH